MRITKFLVAVAGAFGLSGFLAPVQAATVTQCGLMMCYEYDDAQSGISSFGNPFLSGDALVFLVPNFRAESTDGAGLDQAIDSFVIDRVYALSGEAINYVGITEFGDYQITNGDRVSAELELDLEDNVTGETGSVSDLFTRKWRQQRPANMADQQPSQPGHVLQRCHGCHGHHHRHSGS